MAGDLPKARGLPAFLGPCPLLLVVAEVTPNSPLSRSEEVSLL